MTDRVTLPSNEIIMNSLGSITTLTLVMVSLLQNINKLIEKEIKALNRVIEASSLEEKEAKEELTTISQELLHFSDTFLDTLKSFKVKPAKKVK
jgi:low affinity Fe/Cu permease